MDLSPYEKEREERIKENRMVMNMILSGKLSQISCFKLFI